ncbi:MAG TPA: ComF family protein [Thermoflexus sp.]|nr:ComF family protein [Thermoflexus sp.]
MQTRTSLLTLRLPQWITGLAEGILDLLFPPRCAGCGRPGVVWCSTCAADARPITPPICSLCGTPGVTGKRCPRCQEDPLQLEGVRSCFVYHGPIRRALHRLKFHGRYRIAQVLASQMAEGWARFGMEADLLIPVPTSKARQRQRGYNQAAMLGQALAKRLAIPLHPYALRRVRATRSQVGLARSARRENVQGAFLGDPRWVQGKRVVVVDDVCTSGATLEACAIALYQAGAASVWGFTLARVIMGRALHE